MVTVIVTGLSHTHKGEDYTAVWAISVRVRILHVTVQKVKFCLGLDS